MTASHILSIGLTGGIACGKSTVAGVWADAGAEVLEADRVAHKLIQPDGPCYEDVIGHFGNDILKEDGAIDRRLLGQIVFRDEDERQVLNSIVHPVVRQEWSRWVADRLREGSARAAVVVIPLLFEVGAEHGWDAVVCVRAPERDIYNRLYERGLTEEEARRRIEAQWPLSDKAARSDIVIENEGTLETLKTRARQTWKLLRKGGTPHDG